MPICAASGSAAPHWQGSTVSARLQVRTALERKVARERIGIEMAGCVTGPHPLLAVQLVDSLRIFSAVFQLPEDLQIQPQEQYARACTRSLELACPLLEASEQLVRPCLLSFVRSTAASRAHVSALKP